MAYSKRPNSSGQNIDNPWGVLQHPGKRGGSGLCDWTIQTALLPLLPARSLRLSACNALSRKCGTSWQLCTASKVLSPLLNYVGAHIVNSAEFIDAIQQCQVPNSACYVSYDAVSLCTNINNDTAIRVLLELLNNHSKEVSMWGFSANDIETLLEATLACNVFRFNNNFFAQKRGLAMGICIAPLLAIVYLDHIEKASLMNGILLYKRYVDDVFAIGSSYSELNTTLEI